MAHPRCGPLFVGQVLYGESSKTENRETFMLRGGGLLKQGKAATRDERGKKRTAREKAISWLLERLGCRRKNNRADGYKEAKIKWYNGLRWKKGENSRHTNAGYGDALDREDKRDRYVNTWHTLKRGPSLKANAD